MAQPDNKKFFENLTGAGKAIAVLTSGGDAQGTVEEQSHDCNTRLSVLYSIKVFRIISTLYYCDI